MAVQDYKINYKSDFVLNINGDAGWATQFCIKFWTGMPSQAYFVGFDGVKYVNCRVGDTPTQLLVMFDDHHLPIGKLMMQIAYHTTIDEFPGSVFDEVTNARDVIVTIDGTDYQVMLDFTGEDAPELEFDLPAYANEAERIQNELQRQQNEADRIAAELQREQATAAAVQGAENVNAQLNGTTLTVTNRNGVSTSVNTKGEQGAQGPVGPEGPQGEQGVSIVSFLPKSETSTTLIYTITYSNGYTQDVAIPKGPKGDTGATGPTGPQGPQGVSVIGFTQTGETATNTMYNLVFSDGRTQSVAIPKGVKGDKGDKGDDGNVGPQGAQGPKGDTVTATDYTLYNVQGSDSQGAMSQDATTKAISAQTGYYTCGTAAGTPEKVVTVESGNLYKRTLGGHFKVKMTNKNTAASGVTLQIGSETAAALWYNGVAASDTNTWDAGEVISVYYDGTYYQASNSQGGGGKAEKIKYDNSQSGIASENVQGALDELGSFAEYAGDNVEFDSWDTSNTSNPAIRVRFLYTGIEGAIVRCSSLSGYEFGITIFSGSTPSETPLFNTGWLSGSYTYIVPQSGVGVLTINTRKSDNTSISLRESTYNVQKSVILNWSAQVEADKVKYNNLAGLSTAENVQDVLDETIEGVKQIGASVLNETHSISQETGSVGMWDGDDGTWGSSAAIRAHLLINAIGYDRLYVKFPSDYFANFYYVDSHYRKVSTIIEGWPIGSVELPLNGKYNVMANIKKGSAGTTKITASMLNSNPFIVTKMTTDGYNPAASLLIEHDYWDDSNSGGIRFRFLYFNAGGSHVKVSALTGYKVGVTWHSEEIPSQANSLFDSGWLTEGEFDVPNNIGVLTINTRKDDNTAITYEESIANVSKYVYAGQKKVLFSEEKNSKELVTSGGVYAAIHGQGNMMYSGNRIMLEKYSFKGELYMTASQPSGTGQGAAVYGDYFLQGGTGGKVRVYDLLTKSVVANSVSLSDTASTNHVNNICFSNIFPSGNNSFPYMYISEGTGQGRCYVENFTLSGSTLVQTINYSGTDVYERNWAIDTENGFIYLIGNTESASTVQGNMVRVKKFALPLPTAGDVVFTADDVLDTFDMDGSTGKADVFQGNTIFNGKLYSCFGGSVTTHRIWVNNLETHELETVIELDQMFSASECESINIWNGTLLIGYPNNGKLYQMKF